MDENILANPVVVSLLIRSVLFIAVVYVVFDTIKAGATHRWPTTDGRILTSQVIVSGGYKPNVVFEYNVNGQRYQSALVTIDWLHPVIWKGWAQNVVSKYPEGSLVKVYYSPRQSSVAILEHVHIAKILVNMLLIIVIAVFFVLLIIMVQNIKCEQCLG